MSRFENSILNGLQNCWLNGNFNIVVIFKRKILKNTKLIEKNKVNLKTFQKTKWKFVLIYLNAVSRKLIIMLRWRWWTARSTCIQDLMWERKEWEKERMKYELKEWERKTNEIWVG